MGDEALKFGDALNRISEMQITTAIVILVLVVTLMAIVAVFLRSSSAQTATAKSNGETLNRQLELQSKQLDAFNQVSSQVANLERTVAQQNIKNSEYSDNFQKHLTSMTTALDTTLKNSTTIVSVLARVEENGLKMTDELEKAINENRDNVRAIATEAKASNSGVHELAEFVRKSLIDINRALNTIAEKVEDLPQIREQLNDTKTKIDQLAQDVQRMDLPRVDKSDETKEE